MEAKGREDPMATYEPGGHAKSPRVTCSQTTVRYCRASNLGLLRYQQKTVWRGVWSKALLGQGLALSYRT